MAFARIAKILKVYHFWSCTETVEKFLTDRAGYWIWRCRPQARRSGSPATPSGPWNVPCSWPTSWHHGHCRSMSPFVLTQLRDRQEHNEMNSLETPTIAFKDGEKLIICTLCTQPWERHEHAKNKPHTWLQSITLRFIFLSFFMVSHWTDECERVVCCPHIISVPSKIWVNKKKKHQKFSNECTPITWWQTEGIQAEKVHMAYTYIKRQSEQCSKRRLH
jgi:hypothetical protein